MVDKKIKKKQKKQKKVISKKKIQRLPLDKRIPTYPAYSQLIAVPPATDGIKRPGVLSGTMIPETTAPGFYKVPPLQPLINYGNTIPVTPTPLVKSVMKEQETQTLSADVIKQLPSNDNKVIKAMIPSISTDLESISENTQSKGREPSWINLLNRFNMMTGQNYTLYKLKKEFPNKQNLIDLINRLETE